VGLEEGFELGQRGVAQAVSAIKKAQRWAVLFDPPKAGGGEALA
jgi:hypothetical protein